MFGLFCSPVVVHLGIGFGKVVESLCVLQSLCVLHACGGTRQYPPLSECFCVM